MKIGGVEVSGPAEEVLVLPRISGDIVFKAKAVMNMEEFEKRVPEPKAKARLVKGGKWEKNLKDPDYVQAMDKWGDLRFAYMVIQSLEPSEIEWEKVQMDNPVTWLGWTDELQENGFSPTELNRIINCVASANSLNEQKLEAARESFLAGQAEESVESSGPPTELPNTPSGEPASDSE